MLSDSGFLVVGAVIGGVNAYKGTLNDTTDFKPVSLLPQPSYYADTTAVLMRHRKPLASFIPASSKQTTVFNLRGQKVPSRNICIAPSCSIVRRNSIASKTITTTNSAPLLP